MNRAVAVAICICLAAIVVVVAVVAKNRHRQAENAESRDRKIEDVPVFDISATIRIGGPADAEAKRAAIISMVWGRFPTGHPNLSHHGDTLVVRQPHGIDSIVLYRQKGKDCLAIWHNGHDPEGEEMAVPRVFERCDVLRFNMPLVNNPRPTVLTGHGPVRMLHHDAMVMLDNPLYYFLNPVAEVLNYVLARRDYAHVVMAGFSGGGWTTTVYAALDTRIDLSIPVAGSLPLFLKLVQPLEPLGDLEQVYKPLLDIANYQEMYVMAVDRGRRQVQMLNRLDKCCHFGSASRVYVPAVAAKGTLVGGTWEMFMDMDSRRHAVTRPMENVIGRLLKERNNPLP